MSMSIFVDGFADSISFDGYLFVPAGGRPGVDLLEQAQSDLRWIREAFLADLTDHRFVVVYGHAITKQRRSSFNRIGIDTGALCTGRLAA